MTNTNDVKEFLDLQDNRILGLFRDNETLSNENGQLVQTNAELLRRIAELEHPTPTQKTVFGQSFNNKAQIGEEHAGAARVYFQTTVGADYWVKRPEVQRARALGITTFVVSWKDKNLDHVKAFLDGIPDGLTVYAGGFHEPENDAGNPGDASYKAWSAEFKKLWDKLGPAIRDAGHIPTFCNMAWSLYPASKRDINDWVPNKGAADVCGFDNYYGKFDPVETLNRAADVADKLGLPLLIGETGTTFADPKAAEKAKAYREECLKRNVAVACNWPQTVVKDGKVTYDGRWTEPTMKAWYGI